MKLFTVLLANSKFSVLKSTANIFYLEERRHASCRLRELLFYQPLKLKIHSAIYTHGRYSKQTS